jgi:hypothetical protein
MENGYKYRSKYSGLTEKERNEKQRERYNNWKNNLTEEKREELRARIKELNKGRTHGGKCLICEREYTTEKHKRREKLKQEK